MELIKNNNYDLIVLDVNFPGGKSAIFIAEIKAIFSKRENTYVFCVLRRILGSSLLHVVI